MELILLDILTFHLCQGTCTTLNFALHFKVNIEISDVTLYVSPIVWPEIYDQVHFSDALLSFMFWFMFETLNGSQIFHPASSLNLSCQA
jgi:hypothetical protein